MSAARGTFYATIGDMLSLVSDPLLTDQSPIAHSHNAKARILRNGLVVAAFSLMEAYIEDRLNEKIDDLSKTGIVYGLFDEKLRSFLSVNAVFGLSNQIKHLQDTHDKLAHAEAHAPRLAAFSQVPPRYTGLGFSPAGSNVAAADVKSVLSAFGMQDAWGKLARICGSLGVSKVSLEQDYINFHRARNKAAHDSLSNVPSANLTGHLETALHVGMAVDIAISYSIDVYAKESATVRAVSAINAIAPKFRFLEDGGRGVWRENVNSGRSIKKYPDRDSAIQGALARKSGAFIVFRDSAFRPFELI